MSTSLTGFYNYHGNIKKRIENNELVNYEYIANHSKFGNCLMLYFITEPNNRPIREHKIKEYETLLGFKLEDLEISLGDLYLN